MQFSAFSNRSCAEPFPYNSLLCSSLAVLRGTLPFLGDSCLCSSVTLHHIAVPPHTGAIPSRSTVSPRLTLPFRFNSHPHSSFASHFRSYHCLCSSSRLIAVSLPDYSLPMPYLAVPCHSYAIRHGANPLTFGALLCHFNSAHFHGVSILFYSSASQCFTVSMPHLALLLHRGAALLRNVSTLIFTVTLFFRAPFRTLISNDPIPKVFFKSFPIESILSRVFKKTVKFSSSRCSLAHPSSMHVIGYHHAVFAPITWRPALIFRRITG